MDDTLHKHATASIPEQGERPRTFSWGRLSMRTQFSKDVQDHQLRIAHDDGLYRHLKFCRPHSDTCHFQLFTAPGTLGISGDMGTYIFARLEDMFRFFDSPGGRINPDYWSQKVTAQDVHCPVRTYSPAKFRDVVLQDYADRKYAFDPPEQERLLVRINFEILQSNSLYSEHAARELLQDFEFRYQAADGRPTIIFHYDDTDDWDLKDYGHHFLWCLEAIVWGIARYREVTGNV